MIAARPTVRGIVVCAGALAAVVMAWLFGARALNAFVAPALVGLGVGVLQLASATRPTVDRIAPEPGPAGERRELTLRIDARRSAIATVEERVPDALRAERTRFETTIGPGTALSYAIEPDRRGSYEVGPLSVTITDTLGLFVRRFRYEGTTPVVVHPVVRPLSGAGRHDLPLLSEADRSPERGTFDRIREYERGDALRDVHWKSSAKRPDDGLVVKEFSEDPDPEGVTLVATGEPRHADALASAAASIAVHLLESAVDVGVRVADGSVPTGGGPDQRRAVLDLLARTDGGTLDDPGADVLIEATDDGVLVSTPDGRTTLERLVGGANERAERGTIAG